jgi:hypothetical protein
MPQIIPDDLKLQRDSIRGSLNEVNNDIAMETGDSGFGGTSLSSADLTSE